MQLIGEKIRRLRISSHLSQKQLADGWSNRSYISQIESGRKKPSQRALTEIAHRLQCSLADLAADSEDETNILEKLKQSRELFAAGAYDEAYTLSRDVYRYARIAPSVQLRVEARLHLGMCLFRLNKLDEAQDMLLEALGVADEPHMRREMVTCLFYLGHVNYRFENYRQATRYYLRCLALVRGYKTFQDIEVKSLIYLGSALVRTSKFKSAVGAYAKAREYATIMNDFKSVIDAGLGLGWALYESGQVKEAHEVSEDTLAVSRRNQGYSQTKLLHNIGIFLLDLHSQERALHVLNQCLEQYRANHDLRGQLLVLEEKIKIALQDFHSDEAREYIEEALTLLQESPDAELYGRVYRHLGTLHSQTGHAREAASYYDLAIGYFQRIHSDGEVLQTEYLKQCVLLK